MNFWLLVRIASIIISVAVLFALAIKKTNYSGFFEKGGLAGLFLFALFIPLNDGLAVFGMVAAIVFFAAYKVAERDKSLPGTGFDIQAGR